jgi:hypothetical protein
MSIPPMNDKVRYPARRKSDSDKIGDDIQLAFPSLEQVNQNLLQLGHPQLSREQWQALLEQWPGVTEEVYIEGDCSVALAVILVTFGLTMTRVNASIDPAVKLLVSENLPGKYTRGDCKEYAVALATVLHKFGATQIVGYVSQWGPEVDNYHIMVSFIYGGRRYLADNEKATPTEVTGNDPDKWLSQFGTYGKIVGAFKMPCRASDIVVFAT